MSNHAIENERLFDLAGRICDEDVSQEEFVELASIMIVDSAIRRRYMRYCRMHSALRLEFRANRAAQTVYQQIGIKRCAPGSIGLDSLEIGAPGCSVPISSSQFYPAITYFSSAGPMAYLLAAIIVGIGLAIMAVVPVSQATKVAMHSPSAIERQQPIVSKGEIVGRITGMVDCRWNDQSMAPTHDAQILLGQKYTLASGLLEITYDTGARVILQGPVVYNVESENGGFLSSGKLTGKVNTKAARGLTIRTPKATVVDLGTEFGVEVHKDGITEANVFEGKVTFEDRRGLNKNTERVLLAGQAVRLEGKAAATIRSVSDKDRKRFVHEMPAEHRESVPDLIGQVDYSDTWTIHSATRAGSYLVLQEPLAQQIENCHGNSLRRWMFGNECAMTSWPRSDKKSLWPGFQASGAATGILECGGSCYLSLQYGLRDDFVVQFDMVQISDRVNITIGDQPMAVENSPNALSVFFRTSSSDWNSSGHEISVYSLQSTTGEIDTGVRSGISKPYRWHNYAVRFNLPAKQLTIWIDREQRGVVDLTAIQTKMGITGRWAISSQYVTFGGYSGQRNDPIWIDNFRIGKPRERGDQNVRAISSGSKGQ
jgi:hypothetical protein